MRQRRLSSRITGTYRRMDGAKTHGSGYSNNSHFLACIRNLHWIQFRPRRLPSNFVIRTVTDILLSYLFVCNLFNDMVSTGRLCNVKVGRKKILNEGSVRIWKETFVIPKLVQNASEKSERSSETLVCIYSVNAYSIQMFPKPLNTSWLHSVTQGSECTYIHG
jgi:hypothetical protein